MQDRLRISKTASSPHHTFRTTMDPFYPCLMRRSTAFLLPLVLFVDAPSCAQASHPEGYRQLLELFEDWRAFEQPPLLDGQHLQHGPAG